MFSTIAQFWHSVIAHQPCYVLKVCSRKGFNDDALALYILVFRHVVDMTMTMMIMMMVRYRLRVVQMVENYAANNHLICAPT